jgi:GR25 family glycosyltransferase involved in LPS biosynthesis
MIPKPDKIYLIHYTKLTDRLAKIKPTLDATGIPWEIISDYDKEFFIDYSAHLPLFYVKEPDVFKQKIGSLWDTNIHRYRELNLPEISCTAKHFTAMSRLWMECPNYGMILEDDAVFEPEFADKFRKYMNDTPDNWDAIFMGEGCGVDYQQSRISKGKKLSENCCYVGHPSTNCAEAYLMKPNMAKQMAMTAFPFHLVSDWELAYKLYKADATVYWWYPSIVSQGSKNGSYKSELDLGQR